MSRSSRSSTNPERFRSLLLQALRRCDPEYAGPLALSGGVDSLTVLAAYLSAGQKPPCYTITVDDVVSDDSVVARRVTATFGLSLSIVAVPRDLDGLASDIREIRDVGGKLLRTHLQVGQGMLHLARRLRQDGYTNVITGMRDVYGLGRHIQIERSRQGDDWWNGARRASFTNPGQSYFTVEKILNHHGISLSTLYGDPDVVDFMLGLSFEEMHAPRPKIIALRAFPEFWQSGAWYRTPANLQIDSGLRALHETLPGSTYATHATSLQRAYREICA